MNQNITLQRKLLSTKENEIIEALKNILENGYPEIVSDLIELYSKTPFENVKNEIIYILSNLKSANSVQYFMIGLKKINKTLVNQELISTCWQNGLNYSEHLDFFIELVSKDNIYNAIEAFTVIENNFSLLNDEQILTLRKQIMNLKKNCSNENLKLMNELEKLIY